MSEPKWTPGPWQLNKYGSIGGGFGGHGPIVASVTPFYGVDQRWGDHRANALLIAAAPELYEALEAQMKVSEQMMRHAKFSDQDILDCTAQARRVLSIARGETP